MSDLAAILANMQDQFAKQRSRCRILRRATRLPNRDDSADALIQSANSRISEAVQIAWSMRRTIRMLQGKPVAALPARVVFVLGGSGDNMAGSTSVTLRRRGHETSAEMTFRATVVAACRFGCLPSGVTVYRHNMPAWLDL